MTSQELIGAPERCCGCGACADACPVNAISMQYSKTGEPFPEVNTAQCVSCGRCRQVCPMKTEQALHEPQEAFGAKIRDHEMHMKSSSGGIFAALARKILEKGGSVCGVAMQEAENGLCASHVLIDRPEELPALQGSKYLQSESAGIFEQVRQRLERGQKVLFSGTPCQCAALKAFLGQEHPGLTLVDLICHGVPGGGLFRAYCDILAEQQKAKIRAFCFRHKGDELGMLTSCVTLENKKGVLHNKILDAGQSSYYAYFLSGAFYRESCYSCPFATGKRVSDLTVGDYWGVEREHPEILKQDMWKLEEGISCLLVNTEKARMLLKELDAELDIFPSELSRIARHNAQLSAPSKPDARRERILHLYQTGGFAAVDREYRKQNRRRLTVLAIKARMPRRLRRIIRRLRGHTS